MWTELSDNRMTKMEKLTVSIKWQYANIMRLIRIEGSVKKGIKRWWHLRQLCKEVNKKLLKKAKEMENKASKKD